MSCPACKSKLIPIYHGKVDMKVIDQILAGELHVGYRYSLENFYCQNCKFPLRDSEVIE